ncbi:MAG: type II toxin-antitoxin system VapC family toxin [Gemmatimonadetes bacterium]|nr:type II toxin-antitoxin system VapC family toxin [Gemmatimonadota bacterium]
MVIDASALIAILLGEPEAPRLAGAIAADPNRLLGAPTLLQAAAVMLGRKGPQGEIALDALLQRLDIRVVPFTGDAASHARSAFRQYGKGVGSPAVLNYGDCLSYGTAMATGEPLLFKGDDFPQTDVPAAPF